MASAYEFEGRYYFFARAPRSGLVTCAVWGSGPSDSSAAAIADGIATAIDLLGDLIFDLLMVLSSAKMPSKTDGSQVHLIQMLPDCPDGPFILDVNESMLPNEVFDGEEEAEAMIERLYETRQLK